MMLNMIYIILIFATYGITNVELSVCDIRYEYRLLPTHRCSVETCQQPLHIGYLDYPPYVYYKENQTKPVGLLVGMLEEGLALCCQGCETKVTYTRVTDMSQMINHNFSIYMPNSMPEELIYNSKLLLNYPFVGFIKHLKVVYASIATESQAQRQFSFISKRIRNLWPLFGIVGLTTLMAGILIWLTDTWFNITEFPRRFMYGFGEGCWWAFISMTTVGYGDRTPRSFPARLFAVFWIAFGITCSSIMTASLSSIITTVATHENTKMGGKTICTFLDNSLEVGVVYQNGGEILGYGNIEKIASALHNKECSGVAMESQMLLYYWDTLRNTSNLEIIDIIDAPDRSIGIVFFGYDRNQTNSWAEYLTSFYNFNRDHKDTLLANGRKNIKPALQFNLLNQDESNSGIFDKPSGHFADIIIYMLYMLIGLVAFGFIVDAILRLKEHVKDANEKKLVTESASDAMKSSQFNGKQ